ncbi:Rpn family recombination-promoting nuclease/putative transposase [Gracilibacillus massiliensis]|uniref:Rpn family recombination-promoting nuclease/putative transposase n=1 Tax=Gracilibacillus massiliensis TaxID=1564956 RepID=UPI0009E931AC|nr:Rpn family recombination-promoting nuclease/putative transposase [Gracilibacillus massiliensis]
MQASKNNFSEKKSYLSNNTPFQLLKYMMKIWEKKAIKEKTDKLPIIIPLVVYHGENQWNLRTFLGS